MCQHKHSTKYKIFSNFNATHGYDEIKCLQIRYKNSTIRYVYREFSNSKEYALFNTKERIFTLFIKSPDLQRRHINTVMSYRKSRELTGEKQCSLGPKSQYRTPQIAIPNVNAPVKTLKAPTLFIPNGSPWFALNSLTIGGTSRGLGF